MSLSIDLGLELGSALSDSAPSGAAVAPAGLCAATGSVLVQGAGAAVAPAGVCAGSGSVETTVTLDGDIVEGGSVTFGPGASDAPTTSVEYFTPGGSLGIATVAPWEITVTLLPGSYSVTREVDGVLAVGELEFAVDPTAPVVVSPTSSTVTIGDDVPVEVEAETVANTTDVEVYRSRAAVETLIGSDSTDPYDSVVFDTTGRPAGDDDLYARREWEGIDGQTGTVDSEHVVLTLAVPSSMALIVQSFYSSGTFTKPATFQSPGGTADAVDVQAWGSGGGGLTATGGGGGGAYAATTDVAVAANVTVTIGAVGINTTGGDTSFGTDVIAKGGQSRTAGGAGGTAAASTGATKNTGGAGTAGAGSVAGGGGAGTTADGSSANPGAVGGGYGNAALVGRVPAAGGGSSGAAGFAGALGLVRVHSMQPAGAGFSRVVSMSTGRDSGNLTTRNITIPSGTGGMLLLIGSSDGAPTVSATGWTALAQVSQASNSTLFALYRTADGSDPVALATSASEHVNWTCYRLKTPADGVPGAPEWTTTSASSTNADPPNHTPSGGSANYLMFACAAWDTNALNDPQISAFPSGYPSVFVQPAADSSGADLAVCWKEVAGASENPGAFTSVIEQWCAATLSVPPS